MLPVKSIPSNPPNERWCRAGCYRKESLSHILQHCPASHWERILRHDYVVHRLARASTAKGWEVEIETRIRGTDRILRKPDIIMTKGEDVIITDVGIHWEGPSGLRTAYDNKQALYNVQPFIDVVQRKYPNKNLLFLPMITGARGSWCAKNIDIVTRVGLNKSDITNIIHTTLRGGWICHRNFMKRVWSR